MPNKLQWQKILDRTWFYTKLLFALGIFCMVGYGWGTYNPNKSAIADVNTELDKFYVNKIKEMDLQEPEFTYNNDIQFVRAMHKCINYINFTTPKLITESTTGLQINFTTSTSVSVDTGKDGTSDVQVYALKVGADPFGVRFRTKTSCFFNLYGFSIWRFNTS